MSLHLTLPGAVLDFLAATALFHLLKLFAATGALLRVRHGGSSFVTDTVSRSLFPNLK